MTLIYVIPLVLFFQAKALVPCGNVCAPTDHDCPIAGGFHVSPCSPAVGAGMPFPEVTTDFYGNPRDPLHPTIGAVEYIPSNPVPSPPSNLRFTER